MKFSKGKIVFLLFAAIVTYFLSSYKLPFYIQKPGGADALNPIVEVADGYESEGDMHLVTVSGMQATPLFYALAKIAPYNDIMPIEDVFPDGISQEEYMEAQLQVMETSQEAATVVAYTAAGADIEIEYKGVYVVSVLKDRPADGILQSGDRIIAVDGNEIKEAEDLINYIQTREAKDIVTVEFIRGDKTMTDTIELDVIDEADGKIGIGITLVTDREVTVHPEVEFSSGKIGGPSAGLMFSLEIYDQLTEEDLTRGYHIAGTGEIDYEGNVHRIGGIDKKIVAADKEGIDIFFAPNENGKEGSNYEIAVKTAEAIGSDMKIVPVDTFDDALNFLKSLQ
ncbi:hypothetical protein GCM10010978_11120 [Compostibacillus humi]|jgi:PDZ domain-containing protein|uniref:endopeptidase La n=1 Tax=Compostibacillus humi TaxID=1245525 RepID=A0A8J2ZQI5_9BACI|nr:SepM family pheromone-processing serine protease [Compostibacillus humi]GGH73337.1 hypothetical protein GCM10010978_11120 [Compostibacillus humi]